MNTYNYMNVLLNWKGMKPEMEKDVISKINNKINSLKEHISNLDNQKMSRQKLQCTATYKQNLREQRRLEDEQRKFELHKEIVANPDRTIEEWKEAFEKNAKKQVEKNLRDKSKKRISQKTYEKRERRIVAEYKQKLIELDNLNKEIEKFGINRNLLIEELNKRIANNKLIINSKKEERKQLRLQNDLNNQNIEKQKEESLIQLKELELLGENKFVVEKEEKIVINEENDIKIDVEKTLKPSFEVPDIDFKSNKKEEKVDKEKVLDLDFKPKKQKEVKEKKEVKDFSFVKREVNNQSVNKNIITEIKIEEKNEQLEIEKPNIINEIKDEQENKTEKVEFSKNDLTVINVVNNGFAHMKFTVEDLKQYNKTVFDFSGASRLNRKDKRFYRKLAQNARDNGVLVIGYEENETIFSKIKNKLFKNKEQVKINDRFVDYNENKTECKDMEWRKRIVVSKSNRIDFEDDKQVYTNTRKKVAITR